jgi:Bacterial regulatory proteins, luxR family
MSAVVTVGQPLVFVVAEELSERELQVLALLAMPNKAIAKRLFISKQTVKNHITNILRKLAPFGAGTDRTTALLWGLREGKVSLADAWAAVCQDTGRCEKRLHGHATFAAPRVGGACTGGLWRCRKLSGRWRSPWRYHFGVWSR